ncbi:MAG: hypothetical protein Q4B87_03360, partial [Candidatus Saccharibacteria bacterium]|nr:hypothetical protein [Candidatus Saccharibacteria bacterium]
METQNQTPKEENTRPLIITLIVLCITIVILAIAIIVVKAQPKTKANPPAGASETTDDSTSATDDSSSQDGSDVQKESTSLTCSRNMTAAEAASFEGVSGVIEVVTNYGADGALIDAALYKTAVMPSTDADRPDAQGDTYLVEQSTATATNLNGSNISSYYLTTENTQKEKAQAAFTSQGFSCI